METVKVFTYYDNDYDVYSMVRLEVKETEKFEKHLKDVQAEEYKELEISAETYNSIIARDLHNYDLSGLYWLSSIIEMLRKNQEVSQWYLDYAETNAFLGGYQ